VSLEGGTLPPLLRIAFDEVDYFFAMQTFFVIMRAKNSQRGEQICRVHGGLEIARKPRILILPREKRGFSSGVIALRAYNEVLHTLANNALYLRLWYGSLSETGTLRRKC
jgi:hypothetical protein